MAKAKKVIKQSERTVIYPRVVVGSTTPVEITAANTVVSAALARKMLGWETEEQYRERRLKANPKAKEKELTFGDQYLLLDLNGQKVQCPDNLGNRRFRLSHAKSLAQDILNRKWKFNGETIIIGQTGRVLSAQHRLIALVLAAQEWAGPNKAMWEKNWPEEPYINAVVISGIPEDAETVNTLDNVLARTLEDVFTASGVFSSLAGNPKAMSECSRMLAKAVDLLWVRLNCHGGGQKFQTHSASADWLDRHPKLLKAVRFIFDLNQERELSLLRVHPHAKEEEEGYGTTVSLSAGECAAMLYLMAQSQSNYDYYRNNPPSAEKKLDMGLWDRACEFWLELKEGAKGLQPVREALAKLIDLEGSRSVEKGAVIALAWSRYAGKQKITGDDLELRYVENDSGVAQLQDVGTLTFDGADQGIHAKKLGADSADPGKEEVEQATEVNGYRIVEEEGAYNVYHTDQDTTNPLSSHKTEQKAEAWVKKQLAKDAAGKEMVETVTKVKKEEQEVTEKEEEEQEEITETEEEEEKE